MRQRSFEFLDGPFGLSDELITSAGDRNFSGGQGNWVVAGGDDVTCDSVEICVYTNSSIGMTASTISY